MNVCKCYKIHAVHVQSVHKNVQYPLIRFKLKAVCLVIQLLGCKLELLKIKITICKIQRACFHLLQSINMRCKIINKLMNLCNQVHRKSLCWNVLNDRHAYLSKCVQLSIIL